MSTNNHKNGHQQEDVNRVPHEKQKIQGKEKYALDHKHDEFYANLASQFGVSGEITQEVLKVGEYKLPTDIESRYDLEFSIMCPSDEESKQFFATEQVTLLESMVSEINKMKKTGTEGLSVFEMEHIGISPDKANELYGYNQALDDVYAKVQAKIEEYKV